MKLTGKIFFISVFCSLGFLAFAAIFNLKTQLFVYESPKIVLSGTEANENGENVFSDFKEPETELPLPPQEVSLIAVGDVMLSRQVAAIIKKNNDLNYPFLKTKDYLQTGDIVFGNLEGPITAGRVIKSLEMIFRVDPGMEKILAATGFNILSLANNHILNFGERGLKDTFSYLTEAKINYAGAGADEANAHEAALIEKDGIKFAFLAYNYDSYSTVRANRAGTASMDISKMQADVRAAKEKADFVVVSMHAGVEYAARPSKSQTDFAHAAIDAGAELVIGHHPHVVQTLEKYKDKYIFYSLGNFVFDQMWSLKTRQGLAVKFVFGEDGVQKIYLAPVLIENYSQPRFLIGEEAQKITDRLDFSPNDEKILMWDAENDEL